MAQPVLKDLSGGTTALSYSEIPAGALATKFYNDLGGQLHLIGTSEQIAAADVLMQKSPVVFDNIEYNFKA
jgi:hypothetical protein